MASPVPQSAADTDGYLRADFYERMRLLRRFEERMLELLDLDEIAGTAHDYIGQEAVAVGVCAALEADDVITSTHRGHGHALAKGASAARVMAELMGRDAGTNRGRGGSMHLADLEAGMFGANGIVAAGTPIAAGLAWAAKRSGAGRVAVTFFGDGAVNQGVLHETMNLAVVWRLPLIFVCENNHFAVTTSSRQVTAGDIVERAAAYALPASRVDGMDVFAVYRAAAEAVSLARSGEGPAFIECDTYRFNGHYAAERFMRLTYRSEAEISAARRRDPVAALRSELPEGLADEIDERVERKLVDAVDFARSSPKPAAAEASLYTYSDGMHVRGVLG